MVHRRHENETGVAPGAASAEPAKNAEIASAGELAGGAPIARQASSSETPVARTFLIYANEDRAKVLASLCVTAPTITGAEQNLVLLGEDGKAILVVELQPGFDRREVGTALDLDKDPAELRSELAERKDFRPLQVEDPVKVWIDAEHKTFREGEIVAVHDGAHAFDVQLDDGTVTKVAADGLEYDDRR